MSLRAFHIFFIVCAIGLAFGFGVWQYQEYQLSPSGTALLFAAGSFLSGLALMVYLVWFIRKIKEKS